MGYRYVVFGAGRMGRAVAHHLTNASSTESIALVDSSSGALNLLADELPNEKVTFHHIIDMKDLELFNVLNQADVCVATAGYQSYVELTELCIKAHCGMVDLGGNRDVVNEQKSLSEAALSSKVTVIPDCGLAPGMIGILGMLAFQRLSPLCTNIDVNMRVGGLPAVPGSIEDNPLQYALTWSSDGLINEYEIPADELRNNELIQVPALSGCENVTIKTPWSIHEYEAFVTGGGSSNLPFILSGKARNVNYKTLRYRGHCAIMKAFKTLGFFNNEEPLNGVGLRQALTHALDKNLQLKDGNDIVIARAGARGTTKQGKSSYVIYEVFCSKDHNRNFSAMAQTTGYSAAIIAQMIADKTITLHGVVDGEVAVPGDEFVTRLRSTGIRVQGISA